MPYDYNPPYTSQFHFYAVDFTLPPGVNDLVLKIIDDPAGHYACGYLYAIDDIHFAALGPQSTITFNGATGPELVGNRFVTRITKPFL